MKVISMHLIYPFQFSTESATVKGGQNHEPDTNLNSVFKDGKDLSGKKKGSVDLEKGQWKLSLRNKKKNGGKVSRA